MLKLNALPLIRENRGNFLYLDAYTCGIWYIMRRMKGSRCLMLVYTSFCPPCAHLC